MVIGVPKETHHHEHRVGLNPFAVARLIKKGHTVFVESRAGEEAHFSDKDYQEVGAQIVFSPEEAYMRADLVSRFSAITAEELELVRPGQTICAFHHLAISPKDVVAKLMELETTLIGYEMEFIAADGRTVTCAGSSNCRFEDGRPVASKVVAYGMSHPNGVRVHKGYLYVTQSMLPKVEGDVLVSAVYRFRLDDEGVRAARAHACRGAEEEDASAGKPHGPQA